MGQDITDKSTIEVVWNVLPVDYSREKEASIKHKVSDVYSIPLKNVKVSPNFIMVNEKGETVALTNDTIMNIQNPQFQLKLFKEFLDSNEKYKGYDWDLIQSIDSFINDKIDYDVYEKYKKYSIKWIKWSNFLSYGKDNFFDFTKLHSMVLINGNPSNQSGKTTFAIELLRFLLFGKTSKYNTLAQIFNINLPEETEFSVEGEIEIEKTSYIIKRTVTRPTLNKRTDKSKVSQKVEYYRITPSGDEEELCDVDNLEESSGTATNKVIKEAIGTEQDFDLIICATNENLRDLISFKETDRGRLLSRWIGLLPLEEKGKLAKERWKEISKSLYQNVYNSEQLKQEIEVLETANESLKKTLEEKQATLNSIVSNIENLRKQYTTLLESKRAVDESLVKLDITTLKFQMDKMIEDGKKKKYEKEEKEKEVEQYPNNDSFSQELYDKLSNDKDSLLKEMYSIKAVMDNTKAEKDRIVKSEYCPTCHRKFDNVDNTALLNEKDKRINELDEKGKSTKQRYVEVSNKLSSMQKDKENYEARNKLLVEIKMLNLQLENLREKVINSKNTIKSYESNKESIDHNNKVTIEANNAKAKMEAEERSKSFTQGEVDKINVQLKTNEENIKSRNDIIKKIEEEAILIKNWNSYLDMVGKDGISKMVLRETLPIINAELKRLLTDVCNFDVEISITDKNDVIFTYQKEGSPSTNISGTSGLEKTIASLALRAVLANISTMPKLNFLVLDELWGCVADDNLSNIKPFIERIMANYDFILQVSHNPLIMDWHDQIITVTNKDGVSRLVESRN